MTIRMSAARDPSIKRSWSRRSLIDARHVMSLYVPWPPDSEVEIPPTVEFLKTVVDPNLKFSGYRWKAWTSTAWRNIMRPADRVSTYRMEGRSLVDSKEQPPWSATQLGGAGTQPWTCLHGNITCHHHWSPNSNPFWPWKNIYSCFWRYIITGYS